MNKILNKTLFVCLLLISILLINSCNEKTFDEKYSNIVNNSLNACKKLVIDYQITDNNIKVYEYIQEIDFRESVEISEKTYTLSTSTFDLSSEESFKVEDNNNRSNYLSMTIKQELIDGIVETNHSLKLSINKDNISKVLGIDKLTTNSELIIVDIDFENSMVTKISAEMLNPSNQPTLLTITFSY